MRNETSFRKSARKSSGSSAAKPRRQPEAPLGQRLLDSMTELRAHLRGEIQLSETVYHVPPETDVRALREKLGLAYDVYATLDFYSDIGVMSAMAAVGRGRAAAAVRETKRLLADTVATGFSKEEVARGKDALAAQIDLVAEWNAFNAARYAELALFDQQLVTPDEELEMLGRIGAKEFNAFVRERLRWDCAAVCAIGAGPALAAVRS